MKTLTSVVYCVMPSHWSFAGNRLTLMPVICEGENDPNPQYISNVITAPFEPGMSMPEDAVVLHLDRKSSEDLVSEAWDLRIRPRQALKPTDSEVVAAMKAHLTDLREITNHVVSHVGMRLGDAPRRVLRADPEDPKK